MASSNNIKKTLLMTLDFPPNLGGVATYYHYICKNLPTDKIIVLAPKTQNAAVYDSAQNFPIMRNQRLTRMAAKPFCRIYRLINQLWFAYQLRKIVRFNKIQLVQVGQILPLGRFALMLFDRYKMPYIVYAHGLDITAGQKAKRKKILMQKILKNAKAVIANSYFTKDELIKLGTSAQKIQVIYPCPSFEPVSLSEKAIELLKSRHDLRHKKVLLSAGRLIERKGFDQVIKALPLVNKMIDNLTYVIAGTGPQEVYLKNLAKKLGVSNQVIFLGRVTDHELAHFYELADAFIMPARQLSNGDVEGFGIVYLEANIFAKPVIGGKSGGVPEAVVDNQTGLLVNPTDINEIAKAIIKLMTNPALAQKLGLQGLDRVLKDFNWHTQAGKIIKILNN